MCTDYVTYYNIKAHKQVLWILKVTATDTKYTGL